MIIENVYEKLQEENLCSSAYDFSTRYLGMSRSYYSVLKARNENPSIEAIATLEMALLNKSKSFNNNSHPVILRIHSSLQNLCADVRALREQHSQQRLAN